MITPWEDFPLSLASVHCHYGSKGWKYWGQEMAYYSSCKTSTLSFSICNVETIYIRNIGNLIGQYQVLFGDLLRQFRIEHRLYCGHILCKLLLLYWLSTVLEHFSSIESSRLIIYLMYSVLVLFLFSATFPSLAFKL